MSGSGLHSKQNAEKIKPHDEKVDDHKTNYKRTQSNQCEFCQDTPMKIFYIISQNNNNGLMKDIKWIDVLIDNG